MALVMLALLACRAEIPEIPKIPESPESPEITVVVVDTWRADRLHLYGAQRATSPSLDAFARDAVTFTAAYAPSPWTLPSVASILTGLGPQAHTVTETNHTLPAEIETLAERLGAAGYETAFFGSNLYLAPNRKLDQGFETYQGADGLSGEVLNQRVAGFLRSRKTDRPLFLYVHYFEPHCPYEPPPALLASLSEVPPTGRAVTSEVWSALPDCYQLTDGDGEPQLSVDAYLRAYDAEVLQADQLVGSLLETLSAHERLDDGLVAIAGDHGEAFWETGFHGHGRTLEPSVVRVPLVVRPPGGGARTIDEPVSLTAIAPTALRLAGLAVPAGLRGGDLLEGDSPEVLLTTAYESDAATGMVLNGQVVLLEDPLLTDAVAARIRSLNAADVADGAHLKPVPLPPEEDLIKQLKSIGYLH